MKVNRIIPGYVVQEFDTKRKRWVKQTFIAGDETVWERQNGEPLDTSKIDFVVPHMALEMVQPWP
jgi:hypothetical protein